jgi:hypothetical protein
LLPQKRTPSRIRAWGSQVVASKWFSKLDLQVRQLADGEWVIASPNKPLSKEEAEQVVAVYMAEQQDITALAPQPMSGYKVADGRGIAEVDTHELDQLKRDDKLAAEIKKSSRNIRRRPLLQHRRPLPDGQ